MKLCSLKNIFNHKMTEPKSKTNFSKQSQTTNIHAGKSSPDTNPPDLRVKQVEILLNVPKLE